MQISDTARIVVVVFWTKTPYALVDRYQHFREPRYDIMTSERTVSVNLEARLVLILCRAATNFSTIIS